MKFIVKLKVRVTSTTTCAVTAKNEKSARARAIELVSAETDPDNDLYDKREVDVVAIKEVK